MGFFRGLFSLLFVIVGLYLSFMGGGLFFVGMILFLVGIALSGLFT